MLLSSTLAYLSRASVTKKNVCYLWPVSHRLDRQGMLGTNAVAYLSRASVMKKRGKRLIPVAHFTHNRLTNTLAYLSRTSVRNKKVCRIDLAMKVKTPVKKNEIKHENNHYGRFNTVRKSW
jgi:hypothetical protein